MARAKRMGAYNALDDLLPGPPRPRLEPVPDPPLSRRRSRGGPNALDELLPGPRGVAGADDVVPGRPVPRGRSVGGGHLGIWNPLDGPPAAPQPAPVAVTVKARVSFRLPADLVETARDAVAQLAGSADRTTLTALTERALRVELARLAITHNHGQPFPPRDP